MCTSRWGYPNVEVTFSGSSHTGERIQVGEGPDDTNSIEEVRSGGDGDYDHGPDAIDTTTI